MSPKRIQRKRTKGYRLPEGAVYVGRPTKWGNPFRAEKTPFGWVVVEQTPRRTTATPFWFDKHGTAYEAAIVAVRLYELHTGPMGNYEFDDDENNPRDLRGKDLACWCPIDQPCHADVLLRLANEEA